MILLGGEQVRQGCVDFRATGVGEPNQHSAPIVGVIFPLDQSTSGKPVNPIRHGAGGDQRLPDQLAGRERERFARPAERGQHIEFVRLQPVCHEGVGAMTVEAVGEPADPGEHLHRRKIQVGAFSTPGCDEAVDLVRLRVGAGHRGILGVRPPSAQLFRSASVFGMVAARNTMPAHIIAGTIMAWCRPSW